LKILDKEDFKEYLTKALRLPIYTLRNPRFKLIVVRYFATAAIALELLLYARLLGPQSFGSYALAVQIVGFLLLVGAGSGAGYVYAYYKTEDKSIEYIYLLGASLQYLVGVLVLAIFAGFSGSYWLIGSVLLLLQIPYFVTEPMLRVRNQFTLSAIGRASGSMGTIVMTSIVLLLTQGSQPFLHLKFDLPTGFVLMLIGNFIGYSLYYKTILNSGYIQLDFRILVKLATKISSLYSYWKAIIAPTVFYMLSSILFVSFTYIDRLFLEAYYPKINLSVYSLSWQIAQSVLLLLNSLNIISGVRIGESQSQEPKHLVLVANRQLKYSAYAGLAALGVAMLAGWLLSLTIYSDYEGLLSVTSILAFGYLFYGVSGSITMFLFFENQYLKISILYSVMIAISLIGNLISANYKFSYIYPIFFSSLALVITSLSLLIFYQFLSKKYIINGGIES
jgi:O-antigen/teichoic acid export membrane protein